MNILRILQLMFVLIGVFLGSVVCAQLPAEGYKIVVSKTKQEVLVYFNRKFITSSLAVTGRDGYRDLNGRYFSTATPSGVFKVIRKIGPRTIYSPYKPGHVLWYKPSYVAYSLYFNAGSGFMLHDADAWRTTYGPSANYRRSGSHGCVNIPRWFAKWMFENIPVGTRVIIIE